MQIVWVRNRGLLLIAGTLFLTVFLVEGYLDRLYSVWWLEDGSRAPAGRADFVPYWRAFQAMKMGLNPYSPESMRLVQDRTGSHFAPKQHYWNPPWMLAVMSPVLMLPFSVAARLWIYLSICFAVLSSFLIWRSLEGGQRSFALSLISGLCFYPLWETLYWGQLGALVTLGTAGFLWAARRKRDVAAGAFLVLASLKPHLLYLFFVAVGCWTIIERRYRVALSAILIGLALCLSILAYSPQIFQNWWANSDRSWEHISIERTTTFQAFARGLWFDLTGHAPRWPLLVIPAVCATGLTLLLLLRKSIEWTKDLPLILSCSLFTAPYGWLHDHAVLLITQTLAITFALEQESPVATQARTCMDWMVLQLLAFGLGFSFNPVAQYFWFPVAVYFLWRKSLARLGTLRAPR